MTTISIVTFISGDETFSDNFSKLCAMIANSGFLVDAIVYCDHALSNQKHNQCQCRYLNTLGYTKYARIQAAVRDARSDFLLFVDNDLQSDCAACLQFIRDCLAAKCYVAWGRIGSVATPGIVPGMIQNDKRLSHDFIRPFLWSIHLGVSIPGQLFMMDRHFAELYLPSEDTIFDDLTIGIAARIHHVRVFASRTVLGYESPKITVEGLVRQRCRWAKGFAQVFDANFGKSSLLFVIIHALAYHFLWIPFLLFFAFLLLHPLAAFVCLLCFTYWLARYKVKNIPISILYIIVFPFFHFVWIIFFLIAYVKILKNKKCLIREPPQK